MREGDRARPVGWEEAASLAAGRLAKYKAGEVGLVGSPTSTNESLYLLSKLARSVLSTNNLDHPGRASAVPTQILLTHVGEVGCRIDDLSRADAIVAIGLKDGDRCPQIVPQIWRAVGRGATILGVDAWRTDLLSEAAALLHPRPHTDHAWIEAVGTILSPRFAPSRSSRDAAQVCGVDEGAIIHFAELIRGARRIAFVYDTTSLGRLADARAILALSRLLGFARSEKEWVGVLPIFERNNSLGAVDMGVAPDLLPGWRTIADPVAVRSTEGGWGASLPGSKGLPLERMLQEAEAGSLKALLVVGDLSSWGPIPPERIHKALSRLEFFVGCSSFPTAQTAITHVLFPRPLPGEVEGTYTSTEGRVQRTHPAVPFAGWQEWRLIAEIAKRMGARWDCESLERVQAEIARIVPGYAGLARASAEFHRTPWGDGAGESSGSPEPVALAPEDPELPFTLCVERSYLPYHVDPDLQHSPIMRRELVILPPGPHVFIHPDDGRERVLRDGARAAIHSRTGSAHLRVVHHADVPRGRLILPEIFHHHVAEVLGEHPLDRASGRLLYPAVPVRIQPD